MKTRAGYVYWLLPVLILVMYACSLSAPPVNTPAPGALPSALTTVPPTAVPASPTASDVPPTLTATSIPASATPRRKPTATQPPAAPTPTLEEYPHNEKPLTLIANIVISAAADDPRIPLVQQAVDHWNQQFQDIGTPFHLGAVTQIIPLLPEADYEPLSASGMSQIQKQPGDILIILSPDTKFISFTHAFGTRKYIAIQGNPGGRSSLTIDRDIIEHELGHAIGLGHNNQPGALMCGGPSTPAECESFSGAWLTEVPFAPLTAPEIAFLRQIYPPNWKPAP